MGLFSVILGTGITIVYFFMLYWFINNDLQLHRDIRRHKYLLVAALLTVMAGLCAVMGWYRWGQMFFPTSPRTRNYVEFMASSDTSLNRRSSGNKLLGNIGDKIILCDRDNSQTINIIDQNSIYGIEYYRTTDMLQSKIKEEIDSVASKYNNQINIHANNNANSDSLGNHSVDDSMKKSNTLK